MWTDLFVVLCRSLLQSSDTLQISFFHQLPYYYKFTRESANERNLKIGKDLTDITMSMVSLFMEQGVYTQYFI